MLLKWVVLSNLVTFRLILNYHNNLLIRDFYGKLIIERGYVMEQLIVGDYTLTWLDGGVTHLDGGAMFGVVPKPLWSRKYPVNEKNQIELRSDPILIQGNGRTILVESGLGNGKFTEKQMRNYGLTSESKVKENLNELGLSLDDIDTVMMTHLHFDHASGLTIREHGVLQSVFKRAKIIVTDIEWNEMRQPNIRSKNTYWKENWEPIVDQVETYNKETSVAPGITMHHTGGHSDGHAIIVIQSQGETLIHMADIMATHAHQNVLWVMAYDDYPITSIRAKEYWMDYGTTHHAWYSFYHDAYYRAVKWNEKYELLDNIERKRD